MFDFKFVMGGINSSVLFILEMCCLDFFIECKNGGYVLYIWDICICCCLEGFDFVIGCIIVYCGGRIFLIYLFEIFLYLYFGLKLNVFILFF